MRAQGPESQGGSEPDNHWRGADDFHGTRDDEADDEGHEWRVEQQRLSWEILDAFREAALDDLFRQVIAWGGAITGEHGIGIAKQRWWPLAVSKEARALHRTVKRALDPRGILNPGKFV